jgi:hypothetical protein
MVLVGKLTTELGIKSSADKFYNLFASQLHHVQNICDGVHGTKIHEGEDWHDTETVKHWTHVIGKYMFLIQLIFLFDLHSVLWPIIKKTQIT